MNVIPILLQQAVLYSIVLELQIVIKYLYIIIS